MSKPSFGAMAVRHCANWPFVQKDIFCHFGVFNNRLLGKWRGIHSLQTQVLHVTVAYHESWQQVSEQLEVFDINFCRDKQQSRRCFQK